jgi:hypothetical protein
MEETGHQKLMTQALKTDRYRRYRAEGNFALFARKDGGSLRFVSKLLRAWRWMSIEPEGQTSSKYILWHCSEEVSMQLEAYNQEGMDEAYILK